MGRVAVASIVVLWLIPVSFLVKRIVPDPYMDEMFHVPQAQQYCRGNFRSWDPMITTPPGLRLSCMQAVLSFSDSCSTSILRLTNSVLAVICSILVYEIIIQLRPSLDDKKATLRAVVLSLYPLHWFFTFLYYTDVASLTAVLAMYLLTLKKKYLLSSLLGALSVLIRQTNIIWMLFVACTHVLEYTQSHKKHSLETDDFSTSKEKDDLSANHNGVSLASNLRKRRGNKVVNSCNKFTPQTYVPMTHSSGLLDEIQDIIVISWNHLWELLVSLSPFFLVIVAFVAFVRWNGSIVLDIAHPYLLADNRHYPFYLWQKVINYHWSAKYLMVPLYIYSWFSVACSLGQEMPDEALAVAIFSRLCCFTCSGPIDRVQILYDSVFLHCSPH
ncbi:hypothetical protein OROGR_017535 [Orobanche gracilis]